MKEAKVVIGANFGDEGKGLTTDWFCSQFPKHKRVLNVRFNGGAQAGHTVVTPEGKRHVFSHFGSGSFLPNVATWLGPEFIVNPILFRREYEKLNALGVWPMVYVHPRCLITVPQDMMLNQFAETIRGLNRHGSCGVGIYETKLRGEWYTPISLKDLEENHSGRLDMLDIDYYEYERIEKLFGIPMSHEMREMMVNQNIRAHYDQDVRFMLDHVAVMDADILDLFDYVVFEGAQGLMLDQNNMDFFPHLTPSNTGLANIRGWLEWDDLEEAEVCYVTRPYLTRHGAGKLPDECTRKEVGAGIDQTNHPNEWQGELRYGRLNVPSLIRRCRKDMEKLAPGCAVMSFMLTHMDENVPDMDVTEMQGYRWHISRGPTRNDIVR